MIFTAVRGSVFSFPAYLVSQADPTTYVSNATVAAGDAKISLDFGAFSNLSVLPVVTPTGANKQIMTSLVTNETVGVTRAAVVFSDAAGAQWMDREYVVVFQEASTSTFNPSTDSVGLKAIIHSAATVGAGNLAPGVYSGVSMEVKAAGIQASSFGAGAIDDVAVAGMNLSDVTVRVQPMLYSGMTVGVNNAAGNFSAATVQVSGGTVTGVTNMVESNISQIRGRQILADIFASHISSVVTGQASAGSLAVNAMTADVAEATNDHFNGRVIIWTTGALLGQAASINSVGGYIGFSNGSSRFHFPALTEAPAEGVGFVVV